MAICAKCKYFPWLDGAVLEGSFVAGCHHPSANARVWNEADANATHDCSWYKKAAGRGAKEEEVTPEVEVVPEVAEVEVAPEVAEVEETPAVEKKKK